MISRIKFCEQYADWLEVIDPIIDPEYYPAIRSLYMKDPKTLIDPGVTFTDSNHVIGFLFTLLIETHKQLGKATTNATIQ